MFVTTGLNDIKERLSVAYLAAVTARAGCQINSLAIDKQSVDATIRPISGRKVSFDLQLKATSGDCLEEDAVVFDLPIKNYEDLRDVRSTALHYLMVLVLPPDETSWLVQSEHSLIMNSCAYWIDLRGARAVSSKTLVRIWIPRLQIFDAKALEGIIEAAFRLASPAGGGVDAR